MRCRLAVACALGVAVFAVSVPGRGLSSGSSDTRPPAPRRPNVIIYLVDTLRADHLGVYGYDRDTSPALDRWATGKRGLRPGLCALFLDQAQHGLAAQRPRPGQPRCRGPARRDPGRRASAGRAFEVARVFDLRRRHQSERSVRNGDSTGGSTSTTTWTRPGTAPAPIPCRITSQRAWRSLPAASRSSCTCTCSIRTPPTSPRRRSTRAFRARPRSRRTCRSATTTERSRSSTPSSDGSSTC